MVNYNTLTATRQRAYPLQGIDLFVICRRIQFLNVSRHKDLYGFYNLIWFIQIIARRAYGFVETDYKNILFLVEDMVRH